ncbi:unnamed protein product [Spirodela intermedia]|uniref:Secreted protein n=1 Tax=Spirodela intermedia TaxID=51605 RepID=A0ABN7ECT3_SPIIN|nr:unnamed protein product [Spirodela intermedia]
MLPTHKLLVATAAAVAVLLFSSPCCRRPPAEHVRRPGCTGRWTACFDRTCCNVTYTGSYRFYYNDGWPAYIYRVTACATGTPTWFQEQHRGMHERLPYQSIKQTDTA